MLPKILTADDTLTYYSAALRELHLYVCKHSSSSCTHEIIEFEYIEANSSVIV